MTIYYPLTLGIATQKPREDDAAPHKARHDSWREGISPVSNYTEFPEDQILNRIKDSALTEKRLSIILGEPGAGKSTLFDNWFKRWSEEHTSVCYGMVVPVLVRFRSLDAETCQRKHADELADYFWAQGINKKALEPTKTTNKIYTDAMCRFFRPVWFLDGLDELPDMLLNKDFYEKLVNLPGMKIITCRTAIYQTLRGDAHAYSAHEYHILPIKPAQQKAFLVRNGHAEHTAEELHRKIQANSQIRQLAGNPLMLSLIAENGSELPASRAEFYCQAVQNMWHRKLKGNVDLEKFIGAANAVLPRLAEANKLHKIEFPLEVLTRIIKQEAPDQKAAFEWFKQSGLLTIDDRLGKVSFIHLTFHEYYLACAWKDKPFYDTLMAHWDDARYEETLGLLCALLFADQNRQNELENAIITFVEWGQQTHRDNPEILWAKQRSPLRTALDLLPKFEPL